VTIRWPPGFSPECSDVLARSQLVIEAAPAVVFSHLVTASRWEQNFSGLRLLAPSGGCLGPDCAFDVEIDGLRLTAQVTEFVADHRLAWSGQGIDISTYHAWVISADRRESTVLAGFAARGAAAIALREPDPGAPQRALDRWTADLKAAAERPPC
jgi:hypothetical protein